MKASRIALLVAAVLMLGSCSDAGKDPIRDPTMSPGSTVTYAPASTPTPEISGPVEESGAATVEPTTTETATFSSAEEAERWAAIVPAFEEYWDVVNETYAAGGAAAPTDRMKKTMTGEQLDFWEKSFGNWEEQGRRFEGENQVTWATVAFAAIGSDSGQADVEFCVDMSETRAFESNGDALTKDGDFQKGVAGLEWADNRWKVAGFKEETAYVTSC